MSTSVQRKQQGVSLLELMLALLVISGLLLLATRYYQQTRESLRVTQAIEMINNVVNASYKWLAGQPNFSSSNPSFSIPILVTAQFLPQSYGTTVINTANPWKGSINVVAASTDNNYITISLSNIPPKSCQNLIEKMQNRAITIGGNKQIPTCSSGTTQTFSMSF
jgi:prepilin-type N-terminal cleavage/methylation domain-containing protein